MTGPRGRVALVLPPGGRERPRAASRRLKALLESRFRARTFPAGSAGLLERLAAAFDKERHDAVIVFDHPKLRSTVHALRARTDVPKVLALFPGERPGDGVPRAAEPVFCDELWCFSEDAPALSTQGLNPNSFHLCRRIEASWVRERLGAVAARARPAPVPLKSASVIVPCWNNLRYTRECVRSVLGSGGGSLELILVDNGSTDGTAGYLKSLRPDRRVRVISNPSNRGFAKAINQGMRAARGEALVWLNNDAVVTPGWLERLWACASRAPWIGAAGPVTNECEGLQRISGAGELGANDAGVLAAALGRRFRGRARLVHRLVGFCLLLKREAVEKVGLLDERFGLGCYEDFDYCLRLRQAGYELALAEDAFVYHHGHKSFRDEAAMREQAAANREVFIDKWCRRALEFLDELDPLLARRAR